MKRSRNIVGIAAGVSSLVLIVAGAISYRAAEQLTRTSDAVLRAKELELSLERLLSSMRDAETGQRGFLLSGSEEYLAPYTEALKDLDGRLVTVEARVDAHGGAEDSLRQLREQMDRKLEEMARTIDLFRAGKRVEAVALLNSDQGKQSMDALRVLVGERAEQERRHVERLLDVEHDALLATTRASMAVAVLAILLMIVLVYVVRRDSERVRQSEAALLAADRRKDEFLATLAHELRNPLAPILQSAKLAAHGEASAEQTRWSLGIIERQASHMARLLDDLLDVSRITRGHLEIRKARVSLQEVVESALETAQPYIESAQHQLEVELPRDPIYLEVDSLRIAQVLANLLTNAAKYTPAGGKLRLVATRDGERVRINVRDNGIGVAAEHLPQIFEMFAQVKPTLDRKEAGLGIGLALSKALVELNEGTLEGHSEGLGKGSEFTVTLKLAADQQAPAMAVAAPLPEPAADARKVRVMLADDNRDACDSLEMLLSLEGFEVRTAHDGRSALTLMQEFQPDLALLDIGMPEMNGYEVATEARKQPWGADIKLVAVTGWGQAEDRRRSVAAGFDAHLVKPADFAEVRAMCEQLA